MDRKIYREKIDPKTIQTLIDIGKRCGVSKSEILAALDKLINTPMGFEITDAINIRMEKFK